MKVHIILSDDWELRGNGSGDIEKIQFFTLKKLLSIYEEYNLNATINAEIMQQLNFIAFGDKFSHLKNWAEEWEEIILSAYQRGHDVQLHVHPQWSDCDYDGQSWSLKGDWSILNYSDDQIREILSSCKTYLENLIRKVDPNYEVVSFRSGAWCVAPREGFLDILNSLGIKLETSICKGIFYNNNVVNLDYRNIEEGFYPYYPDFDDARKVSQDKEEIISIPTHSHVPKRFFNKLGGFIYKFTKKTDYGRSNFHAPNHLETPNDTIQEEEGADYTVWEKEMPKLKLIERFFPVLAREVSDLSGINFFKMKEKIRDIKKRVKQSSFEVVPIILENHTKDIIYFEPLKRLSALLAQDDEIEVLTMSQAYKNFQKGLYPVQMKKA